MKAKIGVMAIVAVALIAVFMLIDAGGNWDYVLPRRAKKIIAILLTGCIIAFSTMVFQTITNNRILTPSIIGLDSLYMFIQTLVIFVFGSTHMTIMNKNVNFLISTGLMVLFAGVLYKFLFRREGQNIYFLLLIGLIFGTLFGSLSTFMQVLIDPNEFQVVQDKMFASFNNVNTDLLILSFVLVIAVGLYFWRYVKYLDVLALGRDQAINLGIPYDFVVKRFLVVIAILVSIATALVGPITFLGLLVANLAHQYMKTYQHKFLLAGSALISVVALVGGLLIVERVFTFSTTLSVIVNFIGGVYFIYLLLKENKA
ncbi:MULTISPECIES: iron chelate uptake ABC transporter family permease subunit [Brevibacillus]|jgi:ABC-type enterochelin transport system, permease component|uniref:Putative ABC transporter permease protein YclO n=1 Tax=Brevibacillus parabrevis TaxID=54914 RepID=A0A4Y3PGQ4_BREPA|nr:MULTISPECIES: iron chelate uptake ABC transporter family permease subunit [Brevibacillus]KZE49267.1 iron ABC transporter permease [Brevibacillus parabrevis]MBU8713382.1 iron chelate uptake ABC transporter family permease subunit [Brevibacillus parabrevis]MDH6351709.1 iron complex transport system permease protein [Brevibacillus sp. 1238]MDR4997578.1 iron chelate uptake ABC transporter family permease subunit [Brevibacillus parabrevis]MED2255879.1 iron chelate uptake ABC transporter family p